MTTAGNDQRIDRFPDRSASWRLRTRRLEFAHRPLLMGIVNCTPDSFSDGGQYFAAQAAIDHARRLVDDGADIIDIGGESTRPYSTPVDADEELRRVMPVI
ncbi:MAG: dihydropteroate synthase, partial [Pirellulales bacterium]